MNLSYTEVAKRPALLHRLTGLTVKEFETLLESFSIQYDQQVIQPRVKAKDSQTCGGRRTKRSPARSSRQTALYLGVYKDLPTTHHTRDVLWDRGE